MDSPLKNKSVGKRITLGMLATDVASFPGYIDEGLSWVGCVNEAREKDVNLFIFHGDPVLHEGEEYRRPNQIYDMANSPVIDGILSSSGSIAIAIGQKNTADLLKMFQQKKIISLAVPFSEIPAIVVDNSGFRDLMKHLVSVHNVKKPLIMLGPESHSESDDRLKIYQEILAEYQIPFDPDLVIRSNFFTGESRKTISKVIEENRIEFDSVITMDEDMAIDAIIVLTQKGMSVPDTIKVTGYDDVSRQAKIVYSLTTVHYPFIEMARKGIDSLIRLINGEQIPGKTFIPSWFVGRNSCGCRITDIYRKPCDNSLDTTVETTGVLSRINTSAFLKNAEEVLHGFRDFGEKDRVLDVLRAYIGEIEQGAPGFFMREMERAMNMYSYVFHDSERWFMFTSLLYDTVCPYLLTEKDRLRSEALIFQSRVLVDDVVKRFYVAKGIEVEKQIDELESIEEKILSAFDFDKLIEIIKKEIMLLGIPGYYVALYFHNDKDMDQFQYTVTDTVEFVVAVNEGKEIEILAEDRCFPVSHILPEHYLPKDRSVELIVSPLNFNEDYFGYIVFHVGPCNGSIYRRLRKTISTALKGAILIRRQKIFEEELLDQNRKVEAANMAKSRFLANMSHEIRTPMNAILGFSEILTSEITNPEHKQYLDAISSCGNTLLFLINDILDLSKIEAGLISSHIQPFSILHIFQETRNVFIRKAKDKGLTFTVEMENLEVENVKSDENRFRQILFNLIGNAVKFTDNGYVKLAARSYLNRGGKTCNLVLRIEDTGMGIHENERLRVFESFHQQKGQDLGKYGGTGLGLTITKKLTEMLGGNISIVWSEPGRGTIFEINFPAILVDRGNSVLAPAATAENAGRVMFSPVKVLVVDDERLSRILLKKHLSSYGLTVFESDSGKTTLDIIAKEHPEVIFMDIKMSDIDGLEITRKLKSDPSTASIKVICCSASVLKSEITSAGFDGYLWKPVTRSELLQVLMSMMTPIQKDDIDNGSVLESRTQPDPQKASLFVSRCCDEKIHEKVLLLQQYYIVDEIEAVALLIKGIADCHGIVSISEWAEKLLREAQSFDAEKIPQTLNEFLGLMSIIENLSESESGLR